jgi:hypothetical protein
MQRKLIKIGTEYGVLARFMQKNQYVNACRATVTALDAKYEKYTGGGAWSSMRTEFNDGIEVMFHEDVIQQYDRYKPLSELPSRYNPDRADIIKAGTKVVLTSPKQVIAEWTPIAEARARWAMEAQEEAVEIDNAGDVVEPVVEAVIEALTRHGYGVGERYGEVRIYKDEQKGTDGTRITDASFTMSVTTLAELLGVSIAAS